MLENKDLNLRRGHLAVEQIVMRALEKDADQRFESSSSMLLAMKKARHQPEQALSTPPRQGRDETRSERPSHAHAERPTNRPLLILSALALLALAGVGLGLLLTQDPEPPPTRLETSEAPSPDLQPIGEAIIPAESAPPPDTAPTIQPPSPPTHPQVLGGITFDRERFDLASALTFATQRAQRWEPDVRFTGLVARGVRADGTIDMTANYRYSVCYHFRSPYRSSLPAVGTGSGGILRYRSPHVSLTIQDGDAVVVYPTDRPVDTPFIDPPHCDYAQVFERAASDGAPTGREAYLELADRDGTPTWTFRIGDEFGTVFADDCP